MGLLCASVTNNAAPAPIVAPAHRSKASGVTMILLTRLPANSMALMCNPFYLISSNGSASEMCIGLCSTDIPERLAVLIMLSRH